MRNFLTTNQSSDISEYLEDSYTQFKNIKGFTKKFRRNAKVCPLGDFLGRLVEVYWNSWLDIPSLICFLLLNRMLLQRGIELFKEDADCIEEILFNYNEEDINSDEFYLGDCNRTAENLLRIQEKQYKTLGYSELVKGLNLDEYFITKH